MKSIYLDNAATTAVCQEASEAALRAMTSIYGNPSSTHKLGREAKVLLDASRESVASALGCRIEELVFTSGGTESDNWAIRGAAHANRHVGKHIISSMAEHDAVRKTLDQLEKDGWEITRLKPDKSGAIPVDDVAAALRSDTALVTLMMVNNETGGVTDIAAIARAIKVAKSRALLHTDAVQAFLKIPFSAKTLGADLISISGHKIHAPKGIGALYIKSGLRIPSLLYGGEQENSRRPGTESLPLIAAFGAAAALGKIGMEKHTQHMSELKKKASALLCEEMPQIQLIDSGAPHILSISLPSYKSEVMMNYLEAKEIYVSKSSACKKGKRSHVLEAMGIPDRQIDGTLRIGLSRYTTYEEICVFVQALSQASKDLFPSLR